MKFLHIADLHLDRAFEGVLSSDLPDSTGFYNRIIDLAINESVDLVIFAGDNFHQSRSSFKSQKVFFDGLRRLEMADIPVFLIFGNHDYVRTNQFIEAFPKNVFIVLSEKVETLNLTLKNGETVAVSGFSYQHSWIEESKVSEFPIGSTCDYQIGVYHGEINSQHYAPFSLSELKEKQYDYWALGHIHVPTQLSENIYYSGTPQGRNRKETQSGVNLVTLTKTELKVDRINVADVQWLDLDIALTADSLEDAILEIKNQILLCDDNQNHTILFSLFLNDVGDYADELIQRLQSGELRELLESYTQQIIVKIRVESFKEDVLSTELPIEKNVVQTIVNQLDVAKLMQPILKNKLIHEDDFCDDEFVSLIKQDVLNQLKIEFNFKEENE